MGTNNPGMTTELFSLFCVGVLPPQTKKCNSYVDSRLEMNLFMPSSLNHFYTFVLPYKLKFKEYDPTGHLPLEVHLN